MAREMPQWRKIERKKLKVLSLGLFDLYVELFYFMKVRKLNSILTNLILIFTAGIVRFERNI